MATIQVKLKNGEVVPMTHPDDWSQEQIENAIHESFSDEDKKNSQSMESSEENKLSELEKTHPMLLGLAKQLAQHPEAAKLVQNAADSPLTEAGLSAGPGLINAFKNMINLSPFKFGSNETGFPTVEGRDLSDEPLAPKTERGFPEPKSVEGKIGSTVGDILGAGTGFLAVPGSSTIPGALATGFAQGEGNRTQRTIDSLIGMIVPGALHAKKFGKDFLKAGEHLSNIKGLELNKAEAEKGVFNAKEELASKLNKEIAPVQAEKESLEKSINKLAGESESLSKKSVGENLKKAESDIVKKYNREYEGFNASNAGQSPIKEPVQIKSLEKEYGLNESDFSPDTRKLINKMIGKKTEIPESESISVITGKPTNAASIEFKESNPAKVADYINLWKQVRSEVGELRHSQKMATTPEAKRSFRDKANQLEKFSDSINEKAMSSISKKEAAKYSEIQKGYMNERIPFLEKPLLRNATDKHPEIPDRFFDKLNKLGSPDLIKTLKSAHPELVKAITAHDIRGLSKKSIEELEELSGSDFGKFITKEGHGIIKSLHGQKKAEDLLQKALGKVQTTEIGRKVRQNDINNIIKERPELGKPLNAVAKEQERLRKLKDALMAEGFKLKEAQEGMKKYKSLTSVAKAASAPAAAILGYKKSKPSNSSESEY